MSELCNKLQVEVNIVSIGIAQLTDRVECSYDQPEKSGERWVPGEMRTLLKWLQFLSRSWVYTS